MDLLEESCDHYRNLYKKMVQSTKDVLTLNDLLIEMRRAYETFSKSLETISQKFHEQMSGQRFDDNDDLLQSYQHLSNYILTLSVNKKTLSKNINSEIIEPFKMFIENFRQSNRESSGSAKEWIAEINCKLDHLTERQERFWNNKKKAEDFNDVINKTAESVEKGLCSTSDLQKVTHRSVELKFIAEESQEEYRNSINHANLEWEGFAKNFPSIFSRFQYNDESRVAFSRQTILKLFQFLQQQNTVDLTSSTTCLDKFNEAEKLISASSHTSTDIWELISKGTSGKFLDRLQTQQEKFISYEAHKKQSQDALKKQQEPATSQTLLMEIPMADFLLEIQGAAALNEVFSEEDKKKIENLISNIIDSIKNHSSSSSASLKKVSVDTTISSTKQQQATNLTNAIEEGKPKNSSIRSLLVSLPSDSSESRSDTISTGESLSTIEPSSSIAHLLKSLPPCEYFLDKMSKRVKSSSKFHIELTEERFQELIEILRKILATLNGIPSQKPESSPEIFQNILIIVTRVIKHQKQNSAHKDCLAPHLNSDQLFNSTSEWEALFNHLKSKKLEEKKRQADLLKDEESANLNKNLKKGFKLIGAGIGKLGGFFQKKGEKTQSEEERALESEVSYAILEELNKHLLNLELSSEFSSALIIDLANNKGARPELIVKLLEKQENKKNSVMRRNFGESSASKKKSLTESLNSPDRMKCLLYLTKQILPYLSTADHPWRLLQVCTAFRTQLQKPIFEVFLFRDSEYQWLETNRIQVWLKALGTDKLVLDYEKLKIDVAQRKLDSIDEIIQLDVNRSLNMHQDKLNSTLLGNLLRVFAHNNTNISYCQGMNYVAGYLYLMVLDESQTYKVFHAIMHKQFSVLLTDDFSSLKVVFYQLERLLSIFLPELADHMKQVGVDSNFYATSWFITIFSSVFQYTRQSYLLSVVWDIFICEGWKGFFKTVIWILRHLSQKLLKNDFDEILHMMSDLIRLEIFMFSREDLISKAILPNAANVKSEIKSIKITNSLLKNLENEYTFFQLNIKQKLAALK